MYRTLRLCSSGGGFEAVPDSPRRLDLRRVRAALEQEGWRVVDARVMLIAQSDPEVTISQNGRLLFKTSDPKVADRVFLRLLPVIEGAGDPGL
ncbi:MAG TPA: hypothetical protein VN842_05110 [Thermoplasmata archaeon]|nr:hypothetical protein [Thermoplasmata archaeon]